MSTKIISLRYFCIAPLLFITLYINAQALSSVMEMAKQQSAKAQIAIKKYQESELSYLYYKAERKPLASLITTPVQYSKDVVQRYSYSEDRTYYRTQNNMYSSANIRISQDVGFLGGSIYFDSDFRLYRSFGENGFKQFATIPIRVGYSQSLIGYNPLKWKKRTENLSYTKAQKELLHSLEDIAAAAAERYIAVALLKEERLLAESTLKSCDTLCMKAEQELQYGRISKKVYAELQLERSKAYSVYRQSDIDLIEAESMLRRLLNLAEDVVLDISMEEPTRKLACMIDIPMSDAIQYALENSAEILAKEQSAIEAEQDVEKQKIKRYFDATVNMSLGLHQISETFKGAYMHPLDEQTFSVSISMPLLDFGRGKIMHSRALKKLEIQRIQTEKTKDDVQEQIKQKVMKHPILYSMIDNAKQTYLLSCLTYEETLAEYRLGRWTMNSLSDAVTNRQRALVGYYRSVKNYYENYFQIRNITLYDFEKAHGITCIQVGNII